MEPILSAQQLQHFFGENVPLATAMGARVLEASPTRIRIRFPLAANINHHRTAFGGSLSAAGILAGWSLLHVCLQADGIDAATVVARSSTSYLEPLHADFEAVTAAPPPAVWVDFLDMLRRWGRGRLELRTELRAPDSARPAAVHDGIYVATLKGPPATAA